MTAKDGSNCKKLVTWLKKVSASELDVGVGRGKRGLGCCRQVDLPTAREQTDHRITDVLWRDEARRVVGQLREKRREYLRSFCH